MYRQLAGETKRAHVCAARGQKEHCHSSDLCVCPMRDSRDETDPDGSSPLTVCRVTAQRNAVAWYLQSRPRPVVSQARAHDHMCAARGRERSTALAVTFASAPSGTAAI